MKFFQIKRMNGTAEAVFVDDNGKAGKRVFPGKMTDAQIKSEITGIAAPDTGTVETGDNGNNKQPAAPDADNKAALRAHYIAFLKDKGIDMTTERSFRRIEEAYKENGGK